MQTSGLTANDIVQSSWFKLEPTSNGYRMFIQPDTGNVALRCASVIKPLYMWAASKLPPYVDRVADWDDLAQKAITESSNQATSTVWKTCGSEPVLQELTSSSGLPWADQSDEKAWGDIQITAYSVAASYAKMFEHVHDDPAVGKISAWMTEVQPSQSFDLKTVVAEELAVSPRAVGIKCGWFMDDDETKLRTHAVTVTVLPAGEIIGTAVLTAIEDDGSAKRAYNSSDMTADDLLAIHEQAAGFILRSETKRMIGVAASESRT